MTVRNVNLCSYVSNCYLYAYLSPGTPEYKNNYKKHFS